MACCGFLGAWLDWVLLPKEGTTWEEQGESLAVIVVLDKGPPSSFVDHSTLVHSFAWRLGAKTRIASPSALGMSMVTAALKNPWMRSYQNISGIISYINLLFSNRDILKKFETVYGNISHIIGGRLEYRMLCQQRQSF